MNGVPDEADPLEDLLSDSELFGLLDAGARRRLAAGARRRRLAAGEILFRAGDLGESLYVVIDGSVEVLVHAPDGSERHLARLGPGQCVGELALLTSGRRSATVQAGMPTVLAELAEADFLALVRREDPLRKMLGEMMLRRLPRLHFATSEIFRTLADEVFEELRPELAWVSLRRDQPLFRAGERPRALYVVVNGRLQLTPRDREGGERARTVGRGGTLGDLELLHDAPHRVSARALRDTDLVALSREGFERILERNPGTALALFRRAGPRVEAAGGAPDPEPGAGSTVAVLPLSAAVAGFGRELAASLAQWGRALYLDRPEFDRHHGAGAAALDDDDPRALHVREWLTSREAEHEYLLLDAGANPGPWAARCLRQADRLLLVADADATPESGAAAALVAARAAGIPRELVLIHPGDRRQPTDTARWLAAWRVDRHHHVRRGAAADVARVARFLAGRAVGLVLGAGGARGFAHLGALRALRDHGIPVDAVGGASMGAFLAALIAADYGHDEIVRCVRQVLVERPRGFGYTLPMVSLMSVRRAEQRFRELFGASGIEDQWLGLFCVSVNISNPTMRVHRRGPVWRAVRASLAIPGLIAPLFERGELLVDGALLNPVPADVMHEANPGPVIACDVSKAPALQVDPELEACPSPWQLLGRRLNRWGRRDNVPRMSAILTRCLDVTTLVTNQRNRLYADLYLTPPMEPFRILDMDRIDEIMAAGYEYTARRLEGLDRAAFFRRGALPAAAPGGYERMASRPEGR